MSRISKKSKNIKTDWNLRGLFYRNEKDTQIAKDWQLTVAAYASFEKKYKSGNYLRSSKRLLESLQSYETLQTLPTAKAAYYFYYRKELNSGDQVAARELNKLEQALAKLENSILFYEVGLATLPPSKKRLYLKDKKLAHFHTFLRRIFAEGAHTLSVPEEKIMNLKSLPARSLWISATEKILNQRVVKVGRKELPIHGALMGYMDKPIRERHAIFDATAKVLESVAPVAESELNAIYIDKKISDELRGYSLPYEATIQAYDQSIQSLDVLRSLITTRGYRLSNKFYTIKSKWLGRKLTFIDRSDGKTRLPVIEFEKAVDICREVFYEVNEEYGRIFDTMLCSGQIDVYPKKAKGGGAFCSSGVNLPTLVFLNQSDSLDGLRTLAHEMGHAIHAYRSKNQSPLYEGHSIATAETASTFFEGLVVRRMIEKASGKEKVELLNKYISDNLATIVMCIARFEIELEFHNKVREGGELSWQDMQKIYCKHMKKFAGPDIEIRDKDGLHFIYKPHYRLNFYQYSYSFGSLMSNIMLGRYLKNSDFRVELDQFLSAGETLSVDEIFSSIDIDAGMQATLEEGLSLLEQDMMEFAKLTRV